MAGHQGHTGQVGDVPGANDQSAAVGRLFYLVDHLGDLVDGFAIGAFPTAPLFAINGAQFAIGVGPFVPDGDAMIMQVFDIRLASEEPEQFVDNAFEMQLFGGDQGKPFRQVETHLVTEDALGTGSGSVCFFYPGVEDMLKEIEILLHTCKVQPSARIFSGSAV